MVLKGIVEMPYAAYLLALAESGSTVKAAVALKEGLRVGGAGCGGGRGVRRFRVPLHLRHGQCKVVERDV
jgi:hypothetical protein